MTTDGVNSKITEKHLKRKAIIYIRQSTEKQVKENKESQLLQYALKEKAIKLGFKEVEVIDCDLGHSAAPGASRRIGFDRVIASVAVGEIGIVFGREISRLLRSDKDYCRLVEVCQLFDTLIGDETGIYNPNSIDDQLLLGIKGTISIVELNIIKMRMIAGMEAKAKRGEFQRLPPPGYIWNKMGKVEKDPDKRIQEAIKLIFKKFREIQSIRQTHLWFRSQEIELPVNKVRTGHKEIVWQLPNNSFIKEVLQNPFYAGAYVWGRREVKKEYKNGKIVKRQGKYLEPEKARVFIKNHHEGYIDWYIFKENQEVMRKNCLNHVHDESVGAAREGQGILNGILRCGRCGRKIHVRYWGKSGTSARYVCKGDYDFGGKYCLAFGGSTVDKRFSKELLRIISPYGIDASIEAVKHLERKENEKEEILKRKIQGLEYEARRAFEQYNEVDPRNRLVAAELELRWNEKLEQLEKTKKEINGIKREEYKLTEEDKDKIYQLGGDFASVWESEYCTPSVKKKIIRTVIKEIIVNLEEETQIINFVIHWKGGCHTEFSMPRPVSGKVQKTSLEALDIIKKMAIRYGDDAIAGVLNKLGYRTGKDKRWSQQSVKTARVRYSIKGQKRTIYTEDILSLTQAAKYLNVSHKTVEKLFKNGIIPMKQIVQWAPWEIKKKDLEKEEVKNIIKNLKKTGKLKIKGDCLGEQKLLFVDI